MNKKRQKQIEETALTLLHKTGCYPHTFMDLVVDEGVNVTEIARQLGIELTPYDFGEDVSGVLLRDGEKGKIGYSIHSGKKRQRFTIAHEIGHYVLNHERQGIFVDTPEKYFTLFRDSYSATGEDSQEREANAFAAALLMPLELVREGASYISRSNITRNEDFELIPELAKRFNVSNLAMSYRLTNLDTIW